MQPPERSFKESMARAESNLSDSYIRSYIELSIENGFQTLVISPVVTPAHSIVAPIDCLL